MIYDVIVIGGGPSGLMAAISAAEHGAKTMLVEKGQKLGTKLAISGGGRCNVTNRLPQDEVIKNIPGNGKFLYSAFSVFNNYDIIDYFERMGIALKEEDHGRMFPVSNSAKSVVDTLVNRLHELEVHMQLSTPVKAIHYTETTHHILLQNGEKIHTKAVVIAVGGKSVPHTGSTGDGYAWAKKAGHTITDLYPTEVALTSDERFIKDKTLQGLSLRDVALTVLNKKGKPIITHQMDMVFTHFGISGPAVLRCSQFVVKEMMMGRQKRVLMAIDMLPNEQLEQLMNKTFAAIKKNARKSVKNTLRDMTGIPERLLTYLLYKNEVGEELKAGNVSNDTIRTIIDNIKNFTFYVNGSLSIEKAFVTGGGVSTKEIIPNTMESKLMGRLFFCGEILDIHGYTGGYNITAALVTGRLAGTNAARRALSYK
ncbi:NAD(P)/FAD-dependent oxidoreductase [Pseudogracilibacillus auburnensis]|uniref:NAD(P)/FAD-dependent oxidoreductase n=1 Tax=Pseudogracilibacillus auburnensis TaxID=1494959 RepID=UPI001A957DE2|nr:NAD(P)/FAD-dependent oxidoreductase [Pseudogracilibacillus auburnensis]MBO1002483.1 NAD(P)/FAD-dependent oxidoreductase [Pseudogracilibacillus auburnensis]